mgnify:CR=1 FL=1
MMQASASEVLLSFTLLIFLIGSVQLLDTASGVLVKENCEKVRESAEEIRKLASELKLDAEEYLESIERDACGG